MIASQGFSAPHSPESLFWESETGANQVHEAHDRSTGLGGGRHTLEPEKVRRHEGGFQQQVLRWVTGESQLGECSEVAPGILRDRESVENATYVPFDVADNSVELAQRDTQTPHIPSLMGVGSFLSSNAALVES
jgi:hypothetical protein